MKSVGQLAELVGALQIVGDPQVEVCGLACDSRKVEAGDLFVCVSGFQSDGHHFAPGAVERGARALVVERPLTDLPQQVPQLVVASSRRALALLSAHFCGQPASKLLNIGVTGTNGKTTTSLLIESILLQAGYNPGLVGTIEAHVAGKVLPLANTTPESYDLHHLFAQMVAGGQDSVVMEVSSHALALDRTYGIPFDVAVFTNLTQDHLDFHHTMEEYFAAKAKLFTRLGTHRGRSVGPFAIINLDDPYGARLLELIKSRVPVLTYGTHSEADVRAYNVQAGPSGLSFILETRVGQREINLQLSGTFNLHNALAAAAVGLALRLGIEEVARGLEGVKAVPGRFQLVRLGQDFTVIVDYAHTPDGLENLLDSARQITSGNLSLVFGCGGNRDQAKRPLMGKIAAQKADKVYITTDNPRQEDPQAIVEQILAGIEPRKRQFVEVIHDRAQAIAKALTSAKAGDTVVIAGKGHETYQKFEDRTIHFDDVEQARSILSSLGASRLSSGVQPKVRIKLGWDRCSFDINRYLVSKAR